MKEVEVLLGIMLVVIGSVFLEITGSIVMKFASLVLLSLGVMVYIITVDSLDKTKKKS